MMNVAKAEIRSRREACKEHDETTRFPERRAISCPYHYATARPSDVAKAVGMPKRWIVACCIGGEQALRASRSAHDIRQCARCRRVSGLTSPASAGEATERGVIVTVCVRSRSIHSRRV